MIGDWRSIIGHGLSAAAPGAYLEQSRSLTTGWQPRPFAGVELETAALLARQTHAPVLADLRIYGCRVVVIPDERALPLAESVAGLIAGAEATGR